MSASQRIETIICVTALTTSIKITGDGYEIKSQKIATDRKCKICQLVQQTISYVLQNA